MDISETLAPKSDQLDAIELVAGPRTFTIESVAAGSDEQPVQVKLAGFPRVWRPSKNMRRVLAAGWGAQASAWTGRRVTLFFDPDVTFGKDRTGGTRISHMTDLPGNKPLSIPLMVSRGKSALFVVQPLTDPPRPAQPASTPTPDHTSTLIAAMGAAGLTEKATALAFLSQSVGRDVKASRELTADEVALVVHELQNAPEPTLELEP